MSVPDAEKRVDQVVAEAKILEFALRESLRGAIVNAIRKIGVSEVIYYRWRQEFGGRKIEQVKRLKELELENNRLRKACLLYTSDAADE